MKRKRHEQAFNEASSFRDASAAAVCRIRNQQVSKRQRAGIQKKILQKYYTQVDLPGINSTIVPMYVLNLFLLLEMYVTECRDFGFALESVAQEMLRLILYTDEITPGNILAPCNRRRNYCIYVSARNLRAYLSSELCWWIAALVRSADLKKIVGGLAAATTAVLKHFHNLAFGYSFQGPSRRIILHARVTDLIADVPALAAALGAKNQGGKKPCFRCGNIFNKFVKLSGEQHAAGLRNLDCAFADCKILTSAHIYEIVDFLSSQASTVGKGKLAELEKNLGFCRIPASFLCDRELRTTLLPTQCHYDWMHIFFVAGVASSHVGQLRTLLFRLEWSAERLQDIMKSSRWSCRQKTEIKHWLANAYFSEENVWKATCYKKYACVCIRFLFSFPGKCQHPSDIDARPAFYGALHHLATCRHSR